MQKTDESTLSVLRTEKHLKALLILLLLLSGCAARGYESGHKENFTPCLEVNVAYNNDIRAMCCWEENGHQHCVPQAD